MTTLLIFMSTPKCWLLGWRYPRGRNVHQQWYRPSGVNNYQRYQNYNLVSLFQQIRHYCILFECDECWWRRDKAHIYLQKITCFKSMCMFPSLANYQWGIVGITCYPSAHLSSLWWCKKSVSIFFAVSYLNLDGRFLSLFFVRFYPFERSRFTNG